MARYFGFEPDLKDFYFVSYYSKSDSRVAPVARALHDGGVPLWYDRGLFGAKEWKMQISEKIRLCRAVIVFVTKELIYGDDSYVLNEVDIAKARGKSVYAVFLDDSFDQSRVNDKLINFLVEMKSLHGVWAYAGEDNLSIAERIADMLNVPFDADKAKGAPIKAESTSSTSQAKPAVNPVVTPAAKNQSYKPAATAPSATQTSAKNTASASTKSAPTVPQKSVASPTNKGKKKLPIIIAAVFAAVVLIVGGVWLADMVEVDYIEIGGERYSKDITELDLSDKNITDISALAELTNLTYLNLSFNEISNISALSNLTNLTYLYLSGNNISDISPLKNLTNLTYLYLGFNDISDISRLKNLTNLTDLDLGNNNISDISSLKNLTNLSFLGLGSNDISDISPLENLTNLTYLYLGDNNISNLSPLENLTNLTFLFLWGNPLTDKQVQDLREKLPNCEIIF